MVDNTLKVGLHPGQLAIWNSPARFKVAAAGRRFGKSYLAARMLAVAAMQPTNKYGYKLPTSAGFYYVAPTFDQAKRVMIPKLREFLGYKRNGGLIVGENLNDGFLELINGRRIYIKGADNPEPLRGEGYAHVVLDEYKDMKPYIWTEIIRPALMDYEGECLFIGTPKGKNHFYKLFTKASLYDYETSNDPYPMYEAFSFKSVDNPTLSKNEIKNVIEGDHASREIILQELEASFISGGGSVLRPEWFDVVDKLPDVEGSIVVTVDPSGFITARGTAPVRTDEAVICTTMITPEAWNVMDMQHGRWDVRETALRIMKAATKYPGTQLGIEKGALANAIEPYLNDYMREFNRYITPIPLTHNNTKKTDRIVWALQGRAQRGKIKLLKAEWNRWFLDQVADFPDRLAHDDGLDALAYADQLSSVSYMAMTEYEEWEPLDMVSGY